MQNARINHIDYRSLRTKDRKEKARKPAARLHLRQPQGFVPMLALGHAKQPAARPDDEPPAKRQKPNAPKTFADHKEYMAHTVLSLPSLVSAAPLIVNSPPAKPAQPSSGGKPRISMLDSPPANLSKCPIPGIESDGMDSDEELVYESAISHPLVSKPEVAQEPVQLPESVLVPLPDFDYTPSQPESVLDLVGYLEREHPMQEDIYLGTEPAASFEYQLAFFEPGPSYSQRERRSSPQIELLPEEEEAPDMGWVVEPVRTEMDMDGPGQADPPPLPSLLSPRSDDGLAFWHICAQQLNLPFPSDFFSRPTILPYRTSPDQSLFTAAFDGPLEDFDYEKSGLDGRLDRMLLNDQDLEARFREEELARDGSSDTDVVESPVSSPLCYPDSDDELPEAQLDIPVAPSGLKIRFPSLADRLSRSQSPVVEGVFSSSVDLLDMSKPTSSHRPPKPSSPPSRLAEQTPDEELTNSHYFP